jgi:hypothetical protein
MVAKRLRSRGVLIGLTVHLAHCLGLLHRAQVNLADVFREVADAHDDEPDVGQLCRKLAAQCDDHAKRLAPFAERYGEEAPDEPDRLHSSCSAARGAAAWACFATCTTCS